MGHLFKGAEQNHVVWSTGSAEFYVEPENNLGKIIVGVQCRLGDAEETDMALLDTGATWSIIGGERAQDFDDFPIEVEGITLKSRFGDITGNLIILN